MEAHKYLARKARKEAGLCWDCDNPPLPGRSRCDACLRKNKHTQSYALRRSRHDKRLCWDCDSPVEINKTRCGSCLKKYNDKMRDRDQALKLKTMVAYGGVRCACCGESHASMLTIDHIAQDGASHRKNGERTGPGLYLKLEKLGYPPEYRVLCYNCNIGVYRSLDQVCPHRIGCFSPSPQS